MAESENETPILVINLLFKYSWHAFMLLLTIALIVVLTYVLTFKEHMRPARTVPTPLNSLSLTPASCNLIQNTTTPISSFACLHSEGDLSPDTTPVGPPRTLQYDSTDAHQM